MKLCPKICSSLPVLLRILKCKQNRIWRARSGHDIAERQNFLSNQSMKSNLKTSKPTLWGRKGRKQYSVAYEIWLRSGKGCIPYWDDSVRQVSERYVDIWAKRSHRASQYATFEFEADPSDAVEAIRHRLVYSRGYTKAIGKSLVCPWGQTCFGTGTLSLLQTALNIFQTPCHTAYEIYSIG